jgi:YaiO family outer membrane protein
LAWSLWLGTARAAPLEASVAIEQQNYAAAVRLLQAELAADPGDELARFRLAQVLAWSNDYAAALAEYGALIAQHPDNADYIFGRAQVLGWDRQDGAAVAELERARTLAPDYEAVWQLELAILGRSDRTSAQLESLRALAAQRFPDAAWWRRAEPDTGPYEERGMPTLLTAGIAREALSNGAPDWESLFAQVRHPLDRRRALQAGISHEQRFGASDVLLTGGADWRLSARWSTGVELALGPDTNFLPRGAATAWGLRALPRGWETELRFRRRAYSEADVSSVAVSVARYIGNFRASYGVDFARLHGQATSTAYSAAVSYDRSANTRFSASVVSGQEAEAVGAGLVLRTDVRGIDIGGRHALGERSSVSWWVGSQRQGDLYRRKHVGISITHGR